jgi:hypothetical protein
MFLTRLLPHPPNFSPVAAAALFGAAYFRSRAAGIMVPLIAMLLSDLALEVLTRMGLLGGWLAGGGGFHDTMWAVYLAIALTGLIGLLLRRRKTPVAVASGAVAGSLVFFLLTNFACWPGNAIYAQTWEGLLDCYVKGLEFYRWTLLGDLFYAAVLFGGFALAEHYFPALRASPDHDTPEGGDIQTPAVVGRES